MNLYLVHCGYYDADLGDGIYENHINFFVTAESFEHARTKAKLLPQFKDKRMHVDGLQEIQSVDGFRIKLEEDLSLGGQTLLANHRHRDLAPKNRTASPDSTTSPAKAPGDAHL